MHFTQEKLSAEIAENCQLELLGLLPGPRCCRDGGLVRFGFGFGVQGSRASSQSVQSSRPSASTRDDAHGHATSQVVTLRADTRHVINTSEDIGTGEGIIKHSDIKDPFADVRLQATAISSG